ncbi:hypothetical protein BJF86_02295 [Serinicoccus sp. CNJ-927]|nr:hypothetical protein BJF86_02295 [Serinicoccus sp. CNJ-927]
MAACFWIIPVGASPDEVATAIRVCEESRLPCEVTPVGAIRTRLATDAPGAAVLHGGTPTRLLIDAQRWLADANVPTLILLAQLTEELETILLDRGTNDVLALPVSNRRLGGRLRSLARQAAPPDDLPDEIQVDGNITLSPGSRTVYVGQSPLALTKSEFDLLLTVALRRGSVVSSQELAWALGQDTFSTRALQTHASRIRRKLRSAGAPDVLTSVRGIGYRLNE